MRPGDLVIVGLVVVVALSVSWWRRRSPQPTAAPRTYAAPDRVDRADFPEPTAPWLVVVFASRTCDSCAGVISAAQVLASEHVAVAVEYEDSPTHDRYGIGGVPITVVADTAGTTVSSFVGPVSATDLWAAVAEARTD